MIGGGRIGGLLRDANYRRVWIAGMSIAVSRWLELLAIGVFALEITGSPFLVALLVVLRMLPLVLLGSLVGTFADRISRQRLLALGMSLSAVVSGSVAVLLFFNLAGYWLLALAALAAGCIWSLDQPVRRRMLGDIVGGERLVAALGFDAATANLTRMVGPFLGGILYASFGAPGAFTFSASAYALGAVLTARIDATLSAEQEARPASRIFTDLREGFSYVAGNPDLLRILLVTVVFNIGALPFISMIPVLGAEQLHLSAGWIGALAALEGLGAFLGGMTIAMINPPTGLRCIYFLGVFSYLIFAFVVAWITAPIPAAVVMFMVGLGAAGFSSMQSALTYSAAPAHMRSRVLGLLSICIGAGLIGVANIGLMAEWFGVSAAIKIVSVECMLIMTAIAYGWREMWAGK